MATLHVRNFPDPLYEALRRAAEENGRSIAAMSIALLNESLSTGRRGFPFFRRSGEGAQLGAVDDATRAVVVAAEEVARDLGHTHVGTDALLAALAARSFPGILDAARIRERLERGPGAPAGTIPFGPDAKQALEIALRESLRARTPAI